MPNTPKPADLFAELLFAAEVRFGERSRKNLRFDVQGRSNRTPEAVPTNPDACTVYYFDKAEEHHEQLRFQLAHEAIHVLSGALKRDARKIEEGLAVWYSLSVVSRQYRRKAKAGKDVSKLFISALRLFEKLAPSDEKLTAFRQQCPDLDNATPELIVEIFAVERPIAEELCERVPTNTALR